MSDDSRSNEAGARAVARLLEIMQRLRDPDGGCPWDLEQTQASLVPFTLEEAYEVADAIERGDMDELSDELGDLLFQVVFYAQIAAEEGRFAFADVAEAIGDKLVRRHPHVFGDEQVHGVSDQSRAWEAHKARERSERAGRATGTLEGVSLALPALMRAQKLQRRAARVGFDWEHVGQVIPKIEEELDEVRAAMDQGESPQRLQEELGDLLFACVNLARHAGVDAETALRHANTKFERRFQGVEAHLAEQGRSVHESSLEEMDNVWEAVKRKDRG